MAAAPSSLPAMIAAANGCKPAILDDGVRMMTPPFAGPGDRIVAGAETFDHVERA